MTKTVPKIPPQDLETERTVLGALMIDKDAVVRIADFLVPDDFYNANHQKIYQTILELFVRGEPIDLLTVTAKLKEKNLLKEIGDVEYLTDLINAVPSAAHIAHYANIVKEKKIRRDLIHASSEINENAFDESDNMENLLDRVEQKIFNISQRSRPQKFFPIKEELPLAYERMERMHSGKGALRGLATYFDGLDNILSGFQRSEFIILGARPSFGKTAFALDIARQVAMAGKPVGVFSLEMSRDQVVDRIIAAQAQIPLWRLRTGRLQDETEFSMIQESFNELAKAPLFIDDSPSPNIMQIRSMARRLQLEHGLELLIIDYLQLIQPLNAVYSMVQQVTEISRSLKSLARELNIPVLAVSQLSREVDKREIKIPKLSDLRESGSLEQDADVVLFIYRKDRERLDLSEEEQNLTEIIISKNRNGPLGSVKLRFDQEKVTFKNIDTYHTEPAE